MHSETWRNNRQHTQAGNCKVSLQNSKAKGFKFGFLSVSNTVLSDLSQGDPFKNQLFDRETGHVSD